MKQSSRESDKNYNQNTRNIAASQNQPENSSAQKPPAGDTKQPKGQSEEVDEMGTIHLIDSLQPESKKILNSLVQSVLVTQQENDKNKLELIGKKKALI